MAHRREARVTGPQHARRRRLLLSGIACGPWLARAGIAADDAPYPAHPIRFILPSAIGGSSDLLARLIAGPLGDALGQPIVIEAHPGAAGRIAVDFVQNAPADGHMLLLANNGANAIVPAGRGTAPIAPGKTFAPVSQLTRLAIVVAVAPSLRIDSLNALISRARSSPGALSYATGGPGSTSHMAAALLFQRAGVQLEEISYPGTAGAVRDVLAGAVPVLFTHMGTVGPLVRAGQLRALAVTGSRRIAEFPLVETVAEAGFPGFDVVTWHGVVVRSGTPRSVILRLHAELVRILAAPDLRRQLAAMGMEPVGDSPEQFAATLEADVRRWADVVRARGIVTE